ncbi:orotate phosphoribosyltransferase [Psychrobacter sp. Sarcosine-02u-2]|jgi:orotate phosphoribosyltransferase|uniref:orotate phosphoribosyltransferase n=1 Tax=Psychrobacter TaxID=497 RepID=UPI0007F4A41A|nr:MULTISPECIES: orotate phosphoribosyltransferase [Psychrobacter]MCG3860375.1 orotate phosphoribosyltransferase [Psychrobacter sp. Ps5]OAP72169.1 orotate phosphoribosyltransferase [Psychrobacter sp. SHUES1]PKG83590.1 orotate phosphoribosyltransferase [Psychrobacter sp. Sarcosine-02u-2]WLW65947.1 orotate phosphoribosyltransferase [Psychrobacter sp. van23A]
MLNAATLNNAQHAQNASFSSHQFIQLALDNQVLKFGEFVLKSGRISPYFFNAGLLASGEMLSLLARGYADALAEKMAEQMAASDNGTNEQELVIFGAAYKGIPFVAATAQALWLHHGINAKWGYNRKEAKTHGEGGNLVGADVSGKAVWVLDDVITAGTAMREVVEILEQAGARVAGIIVALDRKEKGLAERSAIQELAETLDVPVRALVDIDDLISYLAGSSTDKDAAQLAKMQHYRAQYGV